MADLVDRIRAELDARIRELRPVAREFERLERAVAALARASARSVPRLRSRVGGPPATAPPEGAAPSKRAAASTATPKSPRAPQTRRSSPPGQTRAKVLEALGAAPGSSAAAVAKAAGVSPSVAATTLSRLVKEGRVRRVRRVQRGSYAVLDTPSVDQP